MRRTALKLISLSCVVLLFSLWAFAQREAGVITGTVTDTSGAVVSGAKVNAKSIATGVVRTTTTNSSGYYTISALPPDTYDVTVEAANFKKFARRVEVSVGSTNDVSAQLAVGATSEVVEVSGLAEAATVNTENQTLSQIVTAQELNALPTDPTRNPYSLVGTSGNVSEDCSSARGATSMGCGYSIDGLRSASTDVLLDGAENVDTFTASVGQVVPLDSLQEFSVLTNNFGAEYGRASGGVVNVVTKSGTNSFHGSAYEFNRISALSSNTYQNNATDTPKGIFTRNDFGFSIGGPVVKNKLFFFNNTEWIRVRSAAPQQFTIIDPGSYSLMATASQNFFNAYGKLGPVSKIASGPCGGGGLTCDQISFLAPSDAGGGAPENTWMEVAKVDYHLTDKTTITGRYASYHELDFPGVVSASPYVGYNTGDSQYDQNALVDVTHVFSPSFVNSAKAVYNRLNGPVDTLGTAPVGPTLYTTSGVPSVLGSPLIYPGYLPDGPGEAIPFGGPQNLYEVYDDATWTHGKHNFKFGGMYINLKDNRVFGAYENAVEILGPTTAVGLADLTGGQIYQFDGAIYPQGKYPCPKNLAGVVQVSPACTLTLPVSAPAFNRNYRYNDMAFYGQDSWKIRQRLTLNLGLRWEYYGVQHNANTALDSNFVLGPGPDIMDQIRNGAVELASQGGYFWKPRYGNFGPRVGFAWDIFGNGKTSLRGGWGIGYERNFGNVTFNAIQNPPNYGVVALQSQAITGTGDLPFMPVYTDNAGPLAGTGSKALPAVSQRAINQNMATAYAETWNLSIDRQITHNSVLSISYAGSHGIHLYDISQVNLAGAGPAYLGDANPSNRLNLQYSAMNYRSDNGYSHYNGLNVGFKANNVWNKGLGFNANYTWAHALDNLSSTFSDSNQSLASGFYSLGYLDSFNPKLNYGNSDYDIRHRFVASATWELPYMKNASSAVERYVLGGWGLGTTFNIRTGAPFSIYDCDNFNGQDCPLYAPATAADLPNHSGSAVPTVIAGANTFNYIFLPNITTSGGGLTGNVGNSLGIPSCSGLYHTGTCVYTAAGLGVPERNQFWGPGYWNFNMNVFKNFKLTERFGLQFRAEMYNIFNHSNAYVNTTNIDISGYYANTGTTASPFYVGSCGGTGGCIQTEKGGPAGFAGQPVDERRNIQLGLRVSF